uniref:Uncharacterized protein n=1 Tax=Laticauda laticaudata TaxID=8630 RepID=A0A8C5S5U5_LATLA
MNAVLKEEPPKRSVFITEFTEQVEMNIRSIIQVGHQLAIIGDECNRRYSGKWEDPLFQLAKGIVACVFQTRFWGKNVMKTVGNSLDKSWRKKLIDNVWLVWIPLNCTFQKWGPAFLMAAFTWLLHELQN